MLFHIEVFFEIKYRHHMQLIPLIKLRTDPFTDRSVFRFTFMVDVLYKEKRVTKFNILLEYFFSK